VLEAEHRLLPAAVRAFCDRRLSIEGRQVRIKGERKSGNALFVPPL
jgi:folate-dependent phosphoribosylglycinamide formyltransferase PurN